MAVPVEAISVIVRVDAIERSYPGGWSAFRDAVPNATLAGDTELARVGFMAPTDVETFIAGLEATGLVFLKDGEAIDVTVVDQQRGSTSTCNWLECGHVTIHGNRIAACRLAGSKLHTLITPEGWVYEGSLSHTFGFVPAGQEDKSLEPLGNDDGLDVFLNRLTGRRVYVGRTSGRKAGSDTE